MINQIILFEPKERQNLYPFSLMHHTSEVRCGALRIMDRIALLFPQAKIVCAVDDSISRSLLRREYTNKNAIKLMDSSHSSLSLMANLLLDAKIAEQITTAIDGETFITFIDANNECIGNYCPTHSAILQNDKTKTVVLNGVKRINYLWDTFDYQAEYIAKDAALLKHLCPTENDSVRIGSNIDIGYNVVLDTTDGIILIDDNATIMHNAVIIGPCYIGKGTIIKAGAKVYNNCSFGQQCKIGGEVDHSIFHAYSNKQHDGFIGNSYICEWVNLGAGTSNSDLKNNYSQIDIELPHGVIHTGKQFIGAMIGDHTKIAINSSINTGTVIGVSAMIANSNLSKKSIPSFAWLDTFNKVTKYDFDKMIHTAEIVMQRRDKTLSEEEIDLMKIIFDME